MFVNITNVTHGMRAYYDINRKRLTPIGPGKKVRLEMHPVAIRALVKAQEKGKIVVEVDDPDALDLPVRVPNPTRAEAAAVADSDTNTTAVGEMPIITADEHPLIVGPIKGDEPALEPVKRARRVKPPEAKPAAVRSRVKRIVKD